LGEVVALRKYEHVYEEVSNKDMRKDYCEFCGRTYGSFETHHIKTSGSGGPECRANKINLCAECHDKAQTYIIKPWELIIRVALRESVPIDVIYQAIGWPIPENIKELEDKSEELSQSTDFASLPYRPYEEIVSMLVETIEDVDTLEFCQGQIMDLMNRMGHSMSSIAAGIGKSVGYVSARIKTYRAFPEDSMRAKDMSWTHHRYAANTDNPPKWIDEAVKNQYSSRELDRAIKGLPIDKPKTDWQIKAEKALDDVNAVLSVGGAAARWLMDEISKLVSSQNSNKKEVA